MSNPVSSVDGAQRVDGHFEVRHENGSGTMFYDTATVCSSPRRLSGLSGYQRWPVVCDRGEAAVDRKPVYEGGKPVYDGDNVRTVSVETVRYKQTPARFGEPKSRNNESIKAPKRKR